MVPSVEPFPSFFCQLYHDEVGIHTFEVHYHFSLPDEQALLQYIWKNIITTSPRCPHNRQMVSLKSGPLPGRWPSRLPGKGWLL